MAIRQLVVSDITGAEVTNGSAVEVTVRNHPKSPDEAKKFDALAEELAALKPVTGLIEVELRYASGNTTELLVTAKDFAAVVPDEVVEQAQSNKGRRRGFTPAS